MRSGWRVPALWGAWLCVLAAIEIIFTPTAIELAPLAGAGAGMVALGLLTRATAGGRDTGPDEDEPVALAETSAATVVLALGIAIFMLGWELGMWMVGIGAGVAAFGAAGIVRERRAQRW